MQEGLNALLENQVKDATRISGILPPESLANGIRTVGYILAPCPFEGSRTRELVVNDSDGVYFCNACGAQGDTIDFYSKMRNTSRERAIVELAEASNIPASRLDCHGHDLSDVLEEASRYFGTRLVGAARGYLHQRGITDESIDRFGLGYAPDSWHHITELLRKKYPEDTLISSGLAARSREQGNLYEVFRGRIMFPTRNEVGVLVGFGGRALVEGEGNWKYLNTCEEDTLYRKGMLLFGFDLAAEEITRKGEACLVEGYTDVIAGHQRGITNMVGYIGSTITAMHARMLRRYTPRVHLVPDNDPGGLSSILKAAPHLLSAGLDVTVSFLPEGKDPADVLRQPDGVEAWSRLERMTVFGAYGRMHGKPTNSTEVARQLNDLVLLAAQIPDQKNRHDAIGEISDALEQSYAMAMEAYNFYVHGKPTSTNTIMPLVPKDVRDLARAFLAGFMKSDAPAIFKLRTIVPQVPPDSFCFTPLERQVYRLLIAELEEHASTDMLIPLWERSADPQTDFFSRERKAAAFDWMRTAVESGRLSQFPYDFVGALQRNVSTRIDVTAQALAGLIRHHERKNLHHMLIGAIREGDRERQRAIIQGLAKMTRLDGI